MTRTQGCTEFGRSARVVWVWLGRLAGFGWVERVVCTGLAYLGSWRSAYRCLRLRFNACPAVEVALSLAGWQGWSGFGWIVSRLAGFGWVEGWSIRAWLIGAAGGSLTGTSVPATAF
eukprot:2604812-Prymnesium_polylepis.1